MRAFAYVRRAVPWRPVLVAAALTTVVVAATQRWPEADLVLLRLAMATAGAGAAFALDDVSAPVVDAAPRLPAWRTGARMVAAAVPALAWAGGVWAADLRNPGLPALALLLEGAGVLAIAVGAAAWLRRRGRHAPGEVVAAPVAFVVLGCLLFRPEVREVAVFPDAIGWGRSSVLWAALAVAGAGVLVLASRNSPASR